MSKLITFWIRIQIGPKFYVYGSTTLLNSQAKTTHLLDGLDLLVEELGLEEVAEMSIALLTGHFVHVQQALVHLNTMTKK